MMIPPQDDRAGLGTQRPTVFDIVAGIDLSDQVCVITGASSGLGRESARALARTGAHVVLAARRADALDETAATIRDEVPEARLSTVTLDLTSPAAIRDAAARIAEIAPAVDVLMNNAGVMFTPFARTAEGFEWQFGTNHLGHFELTRLMVPQLRAAQGARVVNLSSEAHRIADVDLGDLQWERRDYDKFRAYGASKTANILHAVELNRRLGDEGIHACAVHPGRVATALFRHVPDMATATSARTRASGGSGPVREVLTPQHGAATQVWAAVCPKPAGLDGIYYADCAVRADVAPYATSPERAAELWELSDRLCGV